jgi:hypothetical protein
MSDVAKEYAIEIAFCEVNRNVTLWGGAPRYALSARPGDFVLLSGVVGPKCPVLSFVDKIILCSLRSSFIRFDNTFNTNVLKCPVVRKF